MNTTNKFMVSTDGAFIQPVLRLPTRFTKDDALNLAAWLVALADDGPEPKFPALLEAVRES